MISITNGIDTKELSLSDFIQFFRRKGWSIKCVKGRGWNYIYQTGPNYSYTIEMDPSIFRYLKTNGYLEGVNHNQSDLFSISLWNFTPKSI